MGVRTRAILPKVTVPGEPLLPEAPLRSTMLELVVSLQEQGLPEDRLVAQARTLIQSGDVVLTGNFAGCRLD